MKSKSLAVVLFLLSFTFIFAACSEETSTDNGSDDNGSEENENEEESTGEEAAEISNDEVVYALNPVSISAENTVYEFTITNESDEDKELSFTTSQRYEYELRDQDNELVKRFSDDMAFMQVLEDINLPPGESLSYELKLPELEPGTYTLTAYSVAKGLTGDQVTVTFSIGEE
jgi:copper(I)-binding protein